MSPISIVKLTLTAAMKCVYDLWCRHYTTRPQRNDAAGQLSTVGLSRVVASVRKAAFTQVCTSVHVGSSLAAQHHHMLCIQHVVVLRFYSPSGEHGMHMLHGMRTCVLLPLSGEQTEQTQSNVSAAPSTRYICMHIHTTCICIPGSVECQRSRATGGGLSEAPAVLT